MSSITEAIDEAEKLVKPATTPSTPLPVTDVSKTTAATPAATTSYNTVGGMASLLSAPEGSTIINPATGKEMALSYTDMKDVPEGTFVIGLSKPATTVAEAIARVQAAERGEPDPYVTYKVTGLPHAEGEIYKKMDGLYGFMKGGKEYYYVPAEFGGYGVMGTESGQYGRDLAVNLNLRNKDVRSEEHTSELQSH